MSFAALLIYGLLASPLADVNAPALRTLHHAARLGHLTAPAPVTVQRPHDSSLPGDPCRGEAQACSDNEEDGDGDEVFAPVLLVGILPIPHSNDHRSAFAGPRPADARALSSPHPLRC
jgi:hypothetical protein